VLIPSENSAALAAGIARCKAAKTGAGVVRAHYDMSRFQRASGIAAVTRFYDEIIPRRRMRA
jgi:hypothetical protein